jgi:hypothetical protein
MVNWAYVISWGVCETLMRCILFGSPILAHDMDPIWSVSLLFRSLLRALLYPADRLTSILFEPIPPQRKNADRHQAKISHHQRASRQPARPLQGRRSFGDDPKLRPQLSRLSYPPHNALHRIHSQFRSCRVLHSWQRKWTLCLSLRIQFYCLTA